MPGRLGLRVAVLAAALVAVAVVAVLADWSTWTIVAAMTGAWLLVSAIELVASRGETRADGTGEEPIPAGEAPPGQVRVLETKAGAAADDTGHEPEPGPELEPEPPRPPRAPEPVRPPLTAVPGPPPAAPEPPGPETAEPAAEVVALHTRDERPREWNLWELERGVRERAGDDPLRDEERNYLLVYLREFADPDGVLPDDFDALVRDSFGDVIGALPQR